MTKPNEHENLNSKDSNELGVDSSSNKKVRNVKVKFSHKLFVFVGAVISLSWFFEGWRKVQESLSIEHVAILLIGTILTIFFVGIHAYWIYLEEKLKGTLKKRIELFERIYDFFTSKEDHRVNAMAVSKGE